MRDETDHGAPERQDLRKRTLDFALQIIGCPPSPEYSQGLENPHQLVRSGTSPGITIARPAAQDRTPNSVVSLTAACRSSTKPRIGSRSSSTPRSAPIRRCTSYSPRPTNSRASSSPAHVMPKVAANRTPIHPSSLPLIPQTKNPRRRVSRGGGRQKVGRGASCQVINSLSHRTPKLIAST